MSGQKKLIRAKFREVVFERDRHKCVFCDRTDDLDAHHIVDRSKMPDGGYVKENGITLCGLHHSQAEIYHQSGGADWFEGKHPDDLYKLIGSTYEKAVKASERLTVMHSHPLIVDAT